MVKNYLGLLILLLSLTGCKVQPDVAPHAEKNSQITHPLSYTPSQITLIENVTGLSLESSLGYGYSYSISPSLPSGLVLNINNGKIHGIASVVTPETNYTITATLGSEIHQASISIEVKEAPPKNLQYPSSLLSVQRGGALSSFLPSVTGNVVSYSLSSVLPSGFSFNSTTGELAVTNSANLVPEVLYLSLIAHNSGGEASFDFTLEIKDSAPTAITGLSANYIYLKGYNHPTPPNPTTTPSYSVYYTILPALPAGLSLNPLTGLISGTPTEAFTNTTFTLMASNNEGSISTTFDIEVTDPIAGFAYASPITLTNNTPMAILAPAPFSGTPIFSVTSGTLPTGLSLNSSTGEISGTPNVGIGTLSLPQINSFTVTITDSISSQTANVTFNINYEPITFSYPETMTFIKDEAIIPELPIPSGETSLIASYSISLPPPTGITFNTTTGEISGTTTDAPTEGVYEIRALHSSSYVLASKLVTIKTIEKTPLNINYPNIDSNNILSFNLGEAQSETLTYTGGEPTSYSIFPNLPSGLSFNTATGEIYGTASTKLFPTSYKVTASNSAGSVFKTFQLEVKIGPPHNLNYANHIFSIGDGSVLVPNLGFAPDPAIVPTTFTVTPSLPSGLTINSLGEIKATSPLDITSSASYTVTATNESGSTNSSSFTITIQNGPLGANPFNYQDHYDATLTTDVIAIYEGDSVSLLPKTPNYTALSGGKITNWALQSGTLPSGISLNTSSGEIYGIPTVAPRELNPQYTATSTATITIRGTGLPGDYHDEVFKIIVLPKAPSFYLSHSYFIKPHGSSNIFNTLSGLTKNGGHTADTNNGASYSGFRITPAPANFTVSNLAYTLSHSDSCGDPDVLYNLTVTFENATGMQATPISVLIADYPGTHPHNSPTYPNNTSDGYDFNGSGAVQTQNPVYDCGTSSPSDSAYYFTGSYPPLLDLNPSTGAISNNAGLLLKQEVDIKGERVTFSEMLESESSIKVETHFRASNALNSFQYDFTNDGRKDILLYGSTSLNLLEQKNSGAFSRHPASASVPAPNNLKSVTHFDASFGKGIIYVDNDGLNAFTTTTPLLQGATTSATTNNFILQTGVLGDYVHQLNTTTEYLTSFSLTKQTTLSFPPFTPIDYISIAQEDTQNLAGILASPIDFKVLNINGDSISDYAIAHNSNDICIMEKVDEDTVPTSCTTTLNVGSGKTIISMHLESLLGSQDLIVVSQNGSNFYVDVFQNNQDSFATGFTALNLITAPKGSYTNPKFFISEYNGDSMKDIFLQVNNGASSVVWMFNMVSTPSTFATSPVELNSSIFNQTAGSLLGNNTYSASVISLPDMGLDALFYCYQNTDYYCRMPALIPNLRHN